MWRINGSGNSNSTSPGTGARRRRAMPWSKMTTDNCLLELPRASASEEPRNYIVRYVGQIAAARKYAAKQFGHKHTKLKQYLYYKFGAFGAFGAVSVTRTSHHKQLPC
jgi:hypothetical protein